MNNKTRNWWKHIWTLFGRHYSFSFMSETSRSFITLMGRLILKNLAWWLWFVLFSHFNPFSTGLKVKFWYLDFLIHKWTIRNMHQIICLNWNLFKFHLLSLEVDIRSRLITEWYDGWVRISQDFIQNCGNWVKFSGDEVEEEWALEQEGEGSDGGHTRFWGASQDQSDDT